MKGNDMKRLLRMLAVALTVSFLVSWGINAAGAALVSPAHHVNWTARTCVAFSTYEHHKSTANLITMLIDSTHVPFKYLGWDVAQLYVDARSGTKYADDDRQQAFSDCHLTRTGQPYGE
jgi:hypothetical protein